MLALFNGDKPKPKKQRHWQGRKLLKQRQQRKNLGKWGICLFKLFMIGLLFVSAIILCFSFYHNVNDGGTQIEYSVFFTKGGTTTTTTTTTKMITQMDVTERMNYYRQRYKHQPRTTNDYSSDELLQLCGTGPEYSTFFDLDKKHHSRYKEDRRIYNVFFFQQQEQQQQQQYKGTYVELGAFNGKEESNTRFFDSCLDWNGLLIEGNPAPEIWNKLVENRPNAHRMSYVPCCNLQQEAANTTYSFHPVGETNAGIHAQEMGVKTVYDGRNKKLLSEVPCGSLTQVLIDIFPPIGQVSFFSLDVEGSEHLVLENIDFEKVYIEVFMVEVKNSFCPAEKKGKKNNNGNGDGSSSSNGECVSRDRSREILKNAGYYRFSGKISASDVFVHYKSQHLIQKAQQKGWQITEEPANKK